MDLITSAKPSKTQRLGLFAGGITIALLLEVVNVYILRLEPEILHKVIFKVLFMGVFFAIAMPHINRLLSKLYSTKIEYPSFQNDELLENQGPVRYKLSLRKFDNGEIFITNKSLVYKSKENNIKTSEFRIDLNNIDKVIKKKLHLFVDQGIQIKQIDGKEFEFAVNNAETWIQEIEKRYN